MPSSWEQQLTVTKSVIGLLVVATFMEAGLIYVLPAVVVSAVNWRLFFLLFGLGLAASALSFVIFASRMSTDRLHKLASANDPSASPQIAVSAIQANAIIMTALGESCAVYGLVYYALTGDRVRPWAFFALAGAHLIGVVQQVARAQDDLVRLARRTSETT